MFCILFCFHSISLPLKVALKKSIATNRHKVSNLANWVVKWERLAWDILSVRHKSIWIWTEYIKWRRVSICLLSIIYLIIRSENIICSDFSRFILRRIIVDILCFKFYRIPFYFYATSGARITLIASPKVCIYYVFALLQKRRFSQPPVTYKIFLCRRAASSKASMGRSAYVYKGY